MVIRIGLTGGIAAGKSTVSSRLRELGATVIDYDALARQIVEPGGAALPRIVKEFGPQAVGADGRLDRSWLAGQVFGPQAGPQARQRLDAIEHPLIFQQAKRLDALAASETGDAIIVHDIPLLAEVIEDLPFTFAHIVTVEAPEHVRIERMMRTRGMDRGQAQARIDSQSPRSARLAIADTVVDSDADLPVMLARVDRLYTQWARESCVRPA
ncbi:dephospho-CoA kinase [Bifidobacterium thermophilum]|uniref:dephospho-CoA kinase n=1 Tax=Bifidobacterium thermophilum TaxID=33905 RepID=UPI0030B25CC6